MDYWLCFNGYVTEENHKVILFGRRFDTKYFTEEEKQKIEFVKGDLATLSMC